MRCPHCNSGLLWSEDRGSHCDGCDDFDPESDLRDALTRIVGIMENNLLLGVERMSEAQRSSPSAPGGDSSQPND
jgi:hypothetical protein